MTYDPGFYDTITDGSVDSARVVVPLVLDLLDPSTVVDVGAGRGAWSSVFAEHGCKVTAVDGDYVTDPLLPVIPRDLSEPLDLDGTWDLAVSLEVAEHLPESRAEGFVADLCSLSDAVLFSAAIPGQGGVGHVNEQPPAYWAELFERQGYAVTGALRWRIWGDARVENWYRQNLLLCLRDPARLAHLFDGPEAAPLHVVHPVVFAANTAVGAGWRWALRAMRDTW